LARADVRVERVAESLVLIDSASGQAHHLNETAALIWDGCNGSTSVDDLVERVLTAFDADSESARRDVLAAIQQFQDLGLLAPIARD